MVHLFENELHLLIEALPDVRDISFLYSKIYNNQNLHYYEKYQKAF